jgi:uracil-DNA glycosylase
MGNEGDIKLHPQWLDVLGVEFEKDYMRTLRSFLLQRKQQQAVIYPPGSQWFSALNTTPLDQVRVVILGQDPYHGPGQAHGLCFSVLPDVKIPPSLANIFKEINRDLSVQAPDHGCLLSWAKQGVLLLNATLTVEKGNAGAHQGKGWEQFTDVVIQQLNQRKEGLVFMLWGSFAQKKSSMIDASKHLILKSVHPSPLSAHRGFIGCGHFSAANTYLQTQGLEPINWQLAARPEVELMLRDSL